MAWDLRGALLKKEERESARLADFEFRQRARTFALMAAALDPDAEAAETVSLVARMEDEAALKELARRHPENVSGLAALYQKCRAEARAQLVAELGDPSPHRLV